MGTHRGFQSPEAATFALALLLTLALAACGHSDSSSVAPTQAALPTWTPGAGPSPAYTVTTTTGSTEGLHPEKTVGMEFTPVVDVEVSALGYFDGSQNGLRQPHNVGIFDRDSKDQLVGVIITADTPLEGAFRWKSVTPLVLKAGKSYIVAYEADEPMDEEVNGGGDWAPELKPGRCWLAHSSWQCPESAGYVRTVAANFKFKPVSAP